MTANRWQLPIGSTQTELLLFPFIKVTSKTTDYLTVDNSNHMSDVMKNFVHDETNEQAKSAVFLIRSSSILTPDYHVSTTFVNEYKVTERIGRQCLTRMFSL